MTDPKNQKNYKPELILYWLLPIIGAGIPLIFYIFSFSPVLTNELSQIVAYTQYLASNNSHYYAEGWNSSITILPFSIKYFMTTLFSDNTSWSSVLQYSVIISYVIMIITEFILVLAISPRKLVSYAVCALISLALGFYSILTSYSCNSFMLLVSVLLLSSSLLLLGIRTTFKFPIRILVSCLCIVPAILLFLMSGKSNNQMTTIASLKSELAASLAAPIGPNATPESSDDCEATSRGLISYLKCNSIPTLSSDSNTSNIIAVCSESSINTATVPDLSSPDVSIENDCRFVSTVEIVNNNSEFIYIIPNSILADYEKYRFLANINYSDDYYTIFYFSQTEVLSDKDVFSDLALLDSETYDTVLLSMYDISNYDLTYFSTYMAWTCIPTAKRLDDFHLIDDYNNYIFSGKNDVTQYIFCIDPFLLYKDTGFDTTLYKTEIQEKLINPICKNSETVFYFYLPSYSITHFDTYSTDDLVKLRDSYYLLADTVEGIANIKIYYNGSEEFVYNNTYLYEEDSDCLMLYETANTMFLDNLADYTLKKPEEIRNCIDSLISNIQSLRINPLPTYNFSNYCAVICGDSIFANSTDNTSVQNILKNFSGMDYIFRAIGGSTATTIDGVTTSLQYQLDVNAINTDLASTGLDGKHLLFILEFGLNDYFQGLKIDNAEDKKDRATYSGILRSSIELIQSEWPGSQILIVIPGYITMWDNGTKIESSTGSILEKYRAAAINISDEYGTYCFYQCEMGFTQNEADYYLIDHVHYNGRGRYLFAWELMDYIYNEVLQ